MKKVLTLLFILPIHNSFSQCYLTATLKASNMCLGSTLTISAARELTKIIWNGDNGVVKTAEAKFSYSSAGTTVAGQIFPGTASSQLNFPSQIYVDANDNVYVADYYNQRIVKWAPGATSGVIVAGGNGMGSAANQFSGPAGVFVDGQGNIYVADENNNRIQKWGPGAVTGTTVAGAWCHLRNNHSG